MVYGVRSVYNTSKKRRPHLASPHIKNAEKTTLKRRWEVYRTKDHPANEVVSTTMT